MVSECDFRVPVELTQHCILSKLNDQHIPLDWEDLDGRRVPRRDPLVHCHRSLAPSSNDKLLAMQVEWVGEEPIEVVDDQIGGPSFVKVGRGHKLVVDGSMVEDLLQEGITEGKRGNVIVDPLDTVSIDLGNERVTSQIR